MYFIIYQPILQSAVAVVWLCKFSANLCDWNAKVMITLITKIKIVIYQLK